VTQIAAFPAPCVLVLDDYDRVDSGAIHGLLTFLLEYQPPPLHIVLACRTEPPLPLDGLRAAGQLLELRAEDLR
jgi:LuxR family maltose regulon positive regulatory protein